MIHQQTIKKPITASGIEFHTGEQSTVQLLPRPLDSGLTMQVGDSEASVSPSNLADGHRSTTSIQVGDKVISSVEHLLSALFGLGITNLHIEVVSGTEIPILDGSAKPWVDLIEVAGIKKQDKEDIPKKLARTVEFRHGDSEYSLAPNDNFEVEVEIDFPKTIIGRQTASYTIRDPEYYHKNIAPARTFIGDGAGGKLLNRHKVLNRLKSVDIDKPESCPCILYEQMRYITPLRFMNEPATHKLVDFMGDFSLLGSNLACAVKATRPSHLANQLLVKKLASERLFQ
ncbi:MAG TPA: UDP-3-O-acyl-N-acetylglucosamine deacetylase [Candidatus Saccharimonadales bacterium]|nr:UDP-3-O-acyl-N-acetylglucosamine deacetylase [Candidatus Saccharimonadales bacterium]